MKTCRYSSCITLDGEIVYRCYVVKRSTGAIREYTNTTWTPVSPLLKSVEECYKWASDNGYRITGKIG